MLSLIGIFAVSLLLGCNKKPVSPPNLTPKPKPQPVVTPSPEEDDLSAAQTAVKKYIQALYAAKYEAAYNMLSEDSRQKHSLDEFERDAVDTVISYNLDKMQAQNESQDIIKVVVSMSQEEEPGAKAFVMTREEKAWKVVYYKGTPFAPYAE